LARKYEKYKPEFRDEVARLVVETSRSIADVSREYGLNETTVGGWVKKYRAVHAVDEPAQELTERARLRELERRCRELEIEHSFLKKPVLRQGATVSDKYEFIAAERVTHSSENSGDAPTMVRMCVWIGVSKSGYYEWLDRRPSAAARRREPLTDKIRALFEAFGGTYGYRRIHAELLRAGEQVGAELVRRLMRQLGLVPVQPRPFRTTTVPDPDAPETPVDLLRRDFCADRPGSKVVGDITYSAQPSVMCSSVA
jgi:putative transposase